MIIHRPNRSAFRIFVALKSSSDAPHALRRKKKHLRVDNEAEVLILETQRKYFQVEHVLVLIVLNFILCLSKCMQKKFLFFSFWQPSINKFI